MIYKVGDAVVMISEPLNQETPIREFVKGKGGVVTALVPNLESLLITFEGNQTFEIWKMRIRIAYPEEARAIKFVFDLQRV